MSKLSIIWLRFIFFSFVMVLSTNVSAELQKDSTLYHFKLKAAARLTQAFMIDYQKTKLKKQQKLSTAEKEGLEHFSTLISAGSIDTLTKKQVESFLMNESNGWSKEGPIVFQNYLIELAALDYFDNTLKTVLHYNPKEDGRSDIFSDKARQSIFNQLASDWVDIHNNLEKNFNPEMASKNLTTNKSSPPKEIPSQGYIGKTQEIILVVLLFLFIAHSIYNATKSKARKEKYRKVQGNSNPRIEHLESELLRKKGENYNLQQKIRKLEQTLKNNKTVDSGLTDYIKTDGSRIESKSNVEHEWTSKDVKPSGTIKEGNAKQSNVFFISAPVFDMKFLTAEMQEDEKNEPYYRFEGKEEGTFQINISGNIDYEVLFNSPDLYLRNAAEYENSLKADHVRIENISRGKYQIKGDDIIVLQKAKIKFV